MALRRHQQVMSKIERNGHAEGHAEGSHGERACCFARSAYGESRELRYY
jgi:hypothetical protein